jgi:hypothetical protein
MFGFIGELCDCARFRYRPCYAKHPAPVMEILQPVMPRLSNGNE